MSPYSTDKSMTVQINRVAALPLSPRLRAHDVMQLLGVKKSIFYEGMASGRYPKPDGKDGKMPWWRVETIKPYL
jgi:predicted DNA-binding transcriptional regulator AlpA